MRTDKEILQAARDRIADPNRWCAGVYAEDNDGMSIDEKDPKAVSWCAYGALKKEIRRLGDTRRWQIVDILCAALPEEVYSLSDLNDEDGHAAVMAVYSRAIEAAQ